MGSPGRRLFLSLSLGSRVLLHPFLRTKRVALPVHKPHLRGPAPTGRTGHRRVPELPILDPVVETCLGRPAVGFARRGSKTVGTTGAALPLAPGPRGPSQLTRGGVDQDPTLPVFSFRGDGVRSGGPSPSSRHLVRPIVSVGGSTDSTPTQGEDLPETVGTTEVGNRTEGRRGSLGRVLWYRGVVSF